jgi:BirA family biotin operon repressor/biotin-[acetyl-CoA-carboxylase] ligase
VTALQWGDRVEQLVERIGAPLTTSRVFWACASTQDHARSLGLGALVVAQRQTGGRGQRGNVWADTGDGGLAFSVVLLATEQPRRSAAVAQAIVEALSPLAPGRLDVKHPNDVLLDGRKVAGVLIEQADGLAVIGIGINVEQETWPDDLAETAISLRQGGIDIDRLKVLEQVLPGVVAAWVGR